jgi:hypothetical protein
MGDPWNHGGGAPQADPWGGASGALGGLATSHAGALAALSAPPISSGALAAPPPPNDPWGGASAASPVVNGGVYPNLAALGASPSRQPAADPWGAAPSAAPSNPPGVGVLNDPWGAPPSVPAPSANSPQPWTGGSAAPGGSVSPQPWAVSPSRQPAVPLPANSNNNDLFSQGNHVDILSGAHHGQPTSPARSAHPADHYQPPNNPWDLSGLDPMGGVGLLGAGLDLLNGGGQGFMGEETGAKPKKSVESLLGEHSNLVNLDSLVKAKPSSTARNPFSEQPNPFQAAVQPNIFQAAAAPKPSMNELRTTTTTQLQTNGNGSAGANWPGTDQNTVNPFF